MAEYLKYIIKNLEPVRIADDSVSQSGQTDTLRYIPGSTIRGAVANYAADKTGLDENTGLKRSLLSSNGLAFMNAYLTTEEHTLIPSPKGFYEDKTTKEGKKELPVNVVLKGSAVDGLKRASLGRYCYMEDGCIYYYNVETGSDLKIKINAADRDRQSVFRNEYISAGQRFEGYIRLNGSIGDAFAKELFAEGNTVILGNARSAGLGKCLVEKAEVTATIPYQKAGFKAEKECYMMLLSNTVMRGANGEYCGLNLASLEKRFGVKNLQIAFCSTSVKEVKGYNRTWETKLPSMMTYEAGSVFHFTYEGTITAEKMTELADTGIGVRCNEGFGRILFLKDYEKVAEKQACIYSFGENKMPAAKMTADDRETLKIAARGYYINLLNRGMERYVVSHTAERKGGLKNSQLGTVISILTKYRYNPKAARTAVEDYFNHAGEKEKNQRVQKSRASIFPLEKQIRDILDSDLNKLLLSENGGLKEDGKVMGIAIKEFFSEEEESRYKIQLVINLLSFDPKKEA